MGKWMMTMNGNGWYMTKDMGNVRDSATIVSVAKENGWSGKGWILDLPRSAESSKKRIYEYLEPIKDGMVTTTKYMGKTSIFRTPHLVVFANWPPWVTSLSEDRWEIYEIQMDGGMVESSISELKEIQEKEGGQAGNGINIEN